MATETTIYLYDEIGPLGIQADGFARELDRIKTPTLNLRINSPGGNVFEGMAIFSALSRYPGRVVSHIDGLAASIASVVALAGSEVRIAEGAFFMIHDPFAGAVGSARSLRETADVLDKIAATIAKLYTTRTGWSRERALDLMAAETWFTAEEAVAAGLADHTASPAGVSARYNLSAFQHAPAAAHAKGEWADVVSALRRRGRAISSTARR